MFTALNEMISNDSFYFSKDEWEKLFKTLGKTDKEIRLLAVEIARGVQHLVEDQTIIGALDIVEKYANGFAVQQELDAARHIAVKASIVAKAASADSFAAMSISHTSLENARDALYYTAWAARNAVSAAEEERHSQLLRSLCAGAFE